MYIAAILLPFYNLLRCILHVHMLIYTIWNILPLVSKLNACLLLVDKKLLGHLTPKVGEINTFPGIILEIKNSFKLWVKRITSNPIYHKASPEWFYLNFCFYCIGCISFGRIPVPIVVSSKTSSAKEEFRLCLFGYISRSNFIF